MRNKHLGYLLLVTVSSILLSACVGVDRGQRVPSQAQLERQNDVYRSLIYAQAPELRSEPLVFMDGGSSGEHFLVTSVEEARGMQYLRARFHFARDQGFTYRFVDYEQRRLDPATHPTITLIIGREHATQVIEEHHHKTRPGA